MKIGIFGLWHLGCVLTASWSKLGFNVISFDYDNIVVENLKNNIPPIFEPNLKENLISNKKNIKFTTNISDLNDCDFIFISYDTPIDDNDNSDTTILEKSIKELSEILTKNNIIIVSSQTPVKYCSTLRNILKSKNKNLDIAYSPENLRLGEAINCYLYPDKIILGTNDNNTKKRCLKLFNNISNDEDILCMSLESAEMVKHGINSFLATSIVYADNLSDICEISGANINDVIEGIKSDKRIGKKAYLKPGIGFSGGTLGRDVKNLEKINNTNNDINFFKNIYIQNNNRKYSIVDKIEKRFNVLKDKNIGILGLTYKPNTSTLRRSIPLEIANILYDKGYNVYAYDPMADYNELTKELKIIIEDNIEKIINNADFIIILTEWTEFKYYFENNTISKNITIFDTKNYIQKEKLSKNITYYSL